MAIWGSAVLLISKLLNKITFLKRQLPKTKQAVLTNICPAKASLSVKGFFLLFRDFDLARSMYFCMAGYKKSKLWTVLQSCIGFSHSSIFNRAECLILEVHAPHRRTCTKTCCIAIINVVVQCTHLPLDSERQCHWWPLTLSDESSACYS